MKKFKKVVCCILMCALVFSSLSGTTVSAATSKPSQVTNVKLARKSLTSATLTWDKVSGATGYQVYMKTNKSNYKKVKTTKSKSYNVSKLATGKVYSFKVRAYKKSKGKYVYGSFSKAITKKINDYEYLVDTLDYTEEYNSIEVYKNTLFELCGNTYSHGLALLNYYTAVGLTDSDSITYNLNGNFSKLTFYLGAGNPNSGYSDIKLYGDGELLDSFHLEKGNNTISLESVDVTGVYELKISFYRENCPDPGMGEIKLYY